MSPPVVVDKHRKPTFVQKFPHYVRLPKDARSPTNSIYAMYDIVSQERVLWRDSDWSYTLRSSHPFVISTLTKGKVKTIKSRLK